MSELNKKLPPEAFPDISMHKDYKDDYIMKHLQTVLANKEARSLSTSIAEYRFHLDRLQAKPKNKIPKFKRKYLTRKQRKAVNLLKLPKGEWNYDDLKGLNEMWLQYMRENLEFIKGAPKFYDPEWNTFSAIIYKSELIGAKVKIVRSKVPSLIDMEGILVWETKTTFQIVAPDSKLKTIPKETSLFEFQVDNLKFTLFGKHLMTKPGDRSSKKVKTHMLPDIIKK